LSETWAVAIAGAVEEKVEPGRGPPAMKAVVGWKRSGGGTLLKSKYDFFFFLRRLPRRGFELESGD
jgi:hypothetical protein